MRRQHDSAFVLSTHDLGEADLIVTLLAEQHGKVRAVARSARRSRRRFGGLLEPLTRVRATWFEREGRELHRLEGLDCLRSYADMQSEPVRQAACAVLAEVTTAFAHEGQAEPQAFRLLGSVLDALERGGDPWSLLRYFEYWMLRVHGLLPDLRLCSDCGRDLEAGRGIRVDGQGGLRCAGCAPSSGELQKRLTLADREFLASVRRNPPGELPAAGNEIRGRGSVEHLLRRTLESFTERRFRTYRHFRALEALPVDPAN